MENGKEAISIRRLAARCISKSEDEGLRVIDEIVEASFAVIKGPYEIVENVFKYCGGSFFALLYVCLIGAVCVNMDENASHWVWGSTAVTLGFTILSLRYWWWIQYGKSSPQRTLLSLAKGRDDSAIENLLKFFRFLGKEENRLFYYVEGSRRYIDRKILFGNLSLLLLASDSGRRQLVFKPAGPWFDHELFVEVNAGEWVKGAKANPRPETAGRPRKYSYDDILLELLKAPAFLRIDPEGDRCKADLIKLIDAVWSNGNEDDPDYKTVPKETQLYEFVGKIQASLKKNRAWNRLDARIN